jgi:hypothetical protein
LHQTMAVSTSGGAKGEIAAVCGLRSVRSERIFG